MKTHRSQSIQILSSISIIDSITSIQSTGHTPTQQPQKSHLIPSIWIIAIYINPLFDQQQMLEILSRSENNGNNAKDKKVEIKESKTTLASLLQKLPLLKLEISSHGEHVGHAS